MVVRNHLDVQMQKKKKVYLSLTAYGNIDSKRKKQLNLGTKTTEPLEENRRKVFIALVLAMISSRWHQRHRQYKKK